VRCLSASVWSSCPRACASSPADRERPGDVDRGPTDGAAHRAAASGRQRERRADLRLRPGMTGVTVAGVGLHPFGRLTASRPPTWAWSQCAPHCAKRASARAASRRPSAAPPTAASPRATRCEPAGHDGYAHRRRGGRLCQRRRRAHAGEGGHPGRAVRNRPRVRHREDAPGHHPFSFFEPWQEEAAWRPPRFFGLRAQRLCITSGVTKDHLARSW